MAKLFAKAYIESYQYKIIIILAHNVPSGKPGSVDPDQAVPKWPTLFPIQSQHFRWCIR